MKLLKIGGLSFQGDKWVDALNTFEEITVIKYNDKEEKVPGLNYYIFETNGVIKRAFIKFIRLFNEKEKLEFVELFLVNVFRLFLIKDMRRIKKFQFDEVYAAYNDFDDSALLLILFKPLFKGVRVTRAYKESRPGYKFMEKYAFVYSNRVILNSKENKEFFENKYGKSFFSHKDVMVNLDEDVLGTKYINGVQRQKKLSDTDNKIHLVILAGRVMSDTSDKRSGSRLFYIPLIREFLEAGMAVHLHTLEICNDTNGVNQYEVLKNIYPELFFIEPPLDFSGDAWKNSYSVLSRYDYGIMHNYIEGTSNTEFDKYNIPHRYYEYLLSHVIPILPQGKTIVLENTINENKSGVVYKDIIDLKKTHEVCFDCISFDEYIRRVY